MLLLGLYHRRRTQWPGWMEMHGAFLQQFSKSQVFQDSLSFTGMPTVIGLDVLLFLHASHRSVGQIDHLEPLGGGYGGRTNWEIVQRVLGCATPVQELLGCPQTTSLTFTVCLLEFELQCLLLLHNHLFLLGIPFGRCDLLPQFSMGFPYIRWSVLLTKTLRLRFARVDHIVFVFVDGLFVFPVELDGAFRYFTMFRGWVMNTMGSCAALDN